MRFAKTILSPMLALLVLLSGMGFFVDHMVCSISGKHMLAVNARIGDCSDSCERPSENDAFGNECCDFDSNYFKENVIAQQKDERKTVSLSAFHFVPVSTFVADHVSALKAELPCFPDLPPPHVRWHVLFQTFLV